MRPPRSASPIGRSLKKSGVPTVGRPVGPTLIIMKCDLCTEDNGEGIHYHAFIYGKHHWVCESCKKKLKIEAEHVDD